MTQPANPLDQIAAARAALVDPNRPVALYWIPNDERLIVRQASDQMFDDIAAVGLVTLSYGEQMAVMRRMAEKNAVDAGSALLAEAMRAVVIGGPIVADAQPEGGPLALADEAKNPVKPTMLAGGTDALRYVTRMHPIVLERALGAYADLHTAKEKNTKRFFESKTYIAAG